MHTCEVTYYIQYTWYILAVRGGEGEKTRARLNNGFCSRRRRRRRRGMCPLSAAACTTFNRGRLMVRLTSRNMRQSLSLPPPLPPLYCLRSEAGGGSREETNDREGMGELLLLLLLLLFSLLLLPRVGGIWRCMILRNGCSQRLVVVSATTAVQGQKKQKEKRIPRGHPCVSFAAAEPRAGGER